MQQTICGGFYVSDFLSNSLPGDKIDSEWPVCSFLSATTQISGCVHVCSLHAFSRRSCDSLSGNPPATHCCETSACLLSLRDRSSLDCTLKLFSYKAGWTIKPNADCWRSLLDTAEDTMTSVMSCYMLKTDGLLSVMHLVRVLPPIGPFLEGKHWDTRSWAGGTSSNHLLVA